MKNFNKKNYFYTSYVFIALFICPTLALAPLGAWIPVFLSSFLIGFFYKGFFDNFKKNNIFLILLLFLAWIFLSVVIQVKSFIVFEKSLSFLILTFSGYLLSKAILVTPKLKKVILYFSLSFVVSSLIILIDLKFTLGYKIWLSKNFDFNNIKNFYQLKTWISFHDFRNSNLDIIMSYLKNNYDRGLISLLILSVPLFLLCYKFNYKVIGLIIIFLSLFLLISSYSLSFTFACIATFFLSLFFYFNILISERILVFLLGVYFFLSPVILGSLNYKEYTTYENKILEKKNLLYQKYCKEYVINEKCLEFKDNVEPIDFLKHSSYDIANQSLHRLMIWSYTKEKIKDKPILGSGFSSSRNLGSENKKTAQGTNYQLIPLHPHNSILQVWLELGVIGIILYFCFIKIMINKIFQHTKLNNKEATCAFMSFMHIFLVGQMNFGFWQSWWVATIIVTLTLYSLIFKYPFDNERQSNLLS